ncbi:MAG: hypothetical protein IH840_07840 [Candidatus Heimdallarchaeota archaeon]|nr:hypothetical protein [Candidatus Heimdallarchaeota archaeon]
MSKSLESLTELIDSHGMTLADLEYIVKYMVREKISPQLAMRRIKSFDVLKAKLEDNTDHEVIMELKEQIDSQEKSYKIQLEELEGEFIGQIDQKDSELKTLIDEKSSLEQITTDLESQSDLLESEREALRDQLKMLPGLELDEEEPTVAIQPLEDLMSILAEITVKHADVKKILIPIQEALEEISGNQQEMTFSFETFDNSIKNYISSQPKPQGDFASPSSSDSVSKESRIVSSSLAQTRKASTEKPKNKPTKAAKKEVDPKVIQVLDLFLDFVLEADNDKSFQDRISTISEMDEAYEHLGSIGLSQLYSFGTKGLRKKEELIKLLESWKITGVPR